MAAGVLLLNAMGMVRVPAILKSGQLLDGVVILGTKVLFVEIAACRAALICSHAVVA